MLQIVTNAYKDEKHPYENGFIHSRVLEYLNRGIETEVFVLNSQKEKRRYVFENVKVQVGDKFDLIKQLNYNNNATICVHFLSVEIASALEELKERRNIVLFVHGVEALKWYERIFPGIFSSPKSIMSFFKYIINNLYMMPRLRTFLEKSEHNIKFITVSNWMKDKAVKNWKCHGKYDWYIIPNVVDTAFFRYQEKSEKHVYCMLSIRPFSTGKYANDITVRCIKKLMNRLDFSEISFSIIGKGTQYKKIVKPIKKLANVKLENRFLNRDEIIAYHRNNGLFICPTRQDAQGVSMCEAMASGLVPITLYNTAIPEFLPDDTRLVCRNVSDMSKLIGRLLDNPHEFQELSKECSDFITQKCNFDSTVKKEIELFIQLEKN